MVDWLVGIAAGYQGANRTPLYAVAPRCAAGWTGAVRGSGLLIQRTLRCNARVLITGGGKRSTRMSEILRRVR
jgi:hypothetical protein